MIGETPNRPLARLGIVATDACQLNCAYCHAHRSRAGSPPWTAVQAAIDALVDSPEVRVELTFTGGEPLLAWPLVRRAILYSELRQREGQTIRRRVLTNGLLLDEDTVRFLERHRVAVQVSLDGGREAQDARQAGTFGPVVAVLAAIRDRHPAYFERQVSVAITLTPASVQRLAASVAFLLDLGIRTIRVGAAMGTGSAPARPRLVDRQMHELFRMVLDRFQRTGTVPLTAFRKDFPEPRGLASEWVCGAPEGDTLVLDADGRRYPCLAATPTYSGAAPDSIVPHLEAARGAHRPLALFSAASPRYSSFARCASCEWLGRCAVCPLAATQEPHWDDPWRVSDFLCAFERARLKYRERFPCQGVSGAPHAVRRSFMARL